MLSAWYNLYVLNGFAVPNGMTIGMLILFFVVYVVIAHGGYYYILYKNSGSEERDSAVHAWTFDSFWVSLLLLFALLVGPIMVPLQVYGAIVHNADWMTVEQYQQNVLSKMPDFNVQVQCVNKTDLVYEGTFTTKAQPPLQSHTITTPFKFTQLNGCTYPYFGNSPSDVRAYLLHNLIPAQVEAFKKVANQESYSGNITLPPISVTR